MITRTHLACAALVLAVPAIGTAKSSPAMDACVQAFLDSDIAKDRKVIVDKQPDFSPFVGGSGPYQIEVVARERESGKRIARILCQTDAHGSIVSISGLPNQPESLADAR